MSLIPPPASPPATSTPSKPPVRLISVLDRLGLRYLSADTLLLGAAGCWPLPTPVAERDDAGGPESWREGDAFERTLRRCSTIDGRMARLTIKVGQLLNPDAADRVAEYLQEHATAQIVLDAELFDRGGRARVPAKMAPTLARKLLPLTALVVANRRDAAALTGRRVEGPTTMREAAAALFDLGAGAAIVTGAHLDGPPRDWLYDGTGYEELGADRVSFDGDVRGAGGVLSAAATAVLARGGGVVEAAHRARQAVSASLRARFWVTANGLLPASAAQADDAPSGYWIANPVAAAAAIG